jgi:hypothetical protein
LDNFKKADCQLKKMLKLTPIINSDWWEFIAVKTAVFSLEDGLGKLVFSWGGKKVILV